MLGEKLMHEATEVSVFQDASADMHEENVAIAVKQEECGSRTNPELHGNLISLIKCGGKTKGRLVSLDILRDGILIV